ncbi:MAG TPA: AAA family ATPase [Candidatus Saccharimonadales bacterium]|nr:AAA family ATPase [Candidatus Saccharimonadales bacterium]
MKIDKRRTFLYLRGEPGVGKITVARIIQKTLSWKLFWFHELKNIIFDIVEEHRIPKLMDQVTLPVIKFLLAQNQNIIYVRPSPDPKTINIARRAVEKFPNYRFLVVTLAAPYETLAKRVSRRNENYRISNRTDLDKYLKDKPSVNYRGEIVIETDGLSPKQVAEKVLKTVS